MLRLLHSKRWVMGESVTVTFKRLIRSSEISKPLWIQDDTFAPRQAA